MTTFMIHFSWFVLFFLLAIIFFILSVYLTFLKLSLSFSLDLFSSWFLKLSLSFSLDLFSSWFSFTVAFISSVIMMYSYFYMSPYSKPNYFIWLTVFFVLSMLCVINMSNFFLIMLGWDGLGLVSFFLIVYYQNFSSISSGLFTVLMNRIGDCFFIVSISFMTLTLPTFWVSFSLYNNYIILLMLITFMTKSAIFPFSPWLPLAMAAPTPISALVHSSTLVTAGLYLAMRFSFVFYSSSNLMSLFMIFSIFTSFYAGMNAIFETDMKKLIALSTLSHLGFIGMAFSCGLLNLAFFHLLVHALFKSVLFMAMGDIMTNLFHSQDIRFLSSGFFYAPSSFFTMNVSILNLLGLPFMSGYFSKDLVLETLNFTFSSYILVFIVFFNLIFTYFYSYKLFYFSFSTLKSSPYTMVHPASMTHTILILILSLVSLIFGWTWVSFLNYYIIHVSVPLVWKLAPYILNIFVLSSLFLFLTMLSFGKQVAHYYFSNMMFLSNVMMTLMSNYYFSLSFSSSKSLEHGVINWYMNKSIPSALSYLSLLSYKLLSLNPLYMISVSILLFLIIS